MVSVARSVHAKGYHVLATLDELSHRPRGFLLGDLRMGRDQPIVWTRCVGRDRVVCSALGHASESRAEPLHRTLIDSAIRWTMRERPCGDEWRHDRDDVDGGTPGG